MSRSLPFENMLIDVPERVAVCPYCKHPMVVQVEGWEEVGDLWLPDMIHTDCLDPDEPDIDDDAWDVWFHGHSQMPYVHLLPVEIKITEWLRGLVSNGQTEQAKEHE